MLQSTLTGGVSVNETLMHIAQDGRPFGVVGPSGMRHYHGKFGFDTMSKLKPCSVNRASTGWDCLRGPTALFFAGD